MLITLTFTAKAPAMMARTSITHFIQRPDPTEKASNLSDERE
jgi:hypothetical protein